MNTCKIYLSNVDKSGKYSSTCKNTSEDMQYILVHILMRKPIS